MVINMIDDKEFYEGCLDSQLIFDGRVLHVYKDRISLPNGGTSTREYCRHGGAVSVVPLTKEGEVICVRQYRYAVSEVVLEIPAGKLDGPEEDHTEAALRELSEETGYTAARITPIGELLTSPALLSEVIYMYLAEDMTPGDTHPDPDELLDIVKIPLEDMVDRIIRGEITDSKTQAAVLKVWAMKQRSDATASAEAAT